MELRVRVGAATDASFDVVFSKIGAASEAARRKIAADDAVATRQTKKTIVDRLDAQKAAYKDLQSANVARLKSEVDHERDAARQKQRENITAAERTAQEMHRIQERLLQQKAQSEAKRQLGMGGGSFWGGGGGGGGGGRNIPYRMGYWASRNLSPVTPMLSYAGRMANDIVRGTGVDFNVGSMVSNAVGLQKQAVDLSNAAYQPNAVGTSAAQRVEAPVIMEDIKKASDEVALSQKAALDGLREFVGKTGDLDTGRKILADMGMLSRATGTAFEDMVSASGDVALALGDVEGKGDKIKGIMRAIAGQGKLGAVEIKDMAVQMAKLSSRAHEFHGDTGENIAMLGALAQEARQSGGAAKPAQATTAVGAFMDLFAKGARVKEYRALTGRSERDKSGALVSPEEAILEILQSSKGDSLKIGKVIASVQARRATRGFETAYREAGGAKMVDVPKEFVNRLPAGAVVGGKTQAGLLAVVAEFDRLKKSAMGQGEVKSSFDRSMNTTEAHAQKFQNQLQNMVGVMADRVLPALEKLGPSALKVMEAFTGVASWLAENPFAILPVALTAAIGKAGIEQAIRVGVENVTRDVTGGAKGQGFGGGAGVVGNIASGLVIASAAITIAEVGMLAIDNVMEEKTKKQKESIAADIEGGNAETKLKKEIESGNVSPETLKAAQKAADVMGQKAKKEGEGPGTVEKFQRGMARFSGFGDVVDKADREQNKHVAETLKDQQRLLELIRTGTLKVQVTNQPAPPLKAPEWHPPMPLQ